MQFSFFGKRYNLNVARFKSFLLEFIVYSLAIIFVLWVNIKVISGLFLGGM